MTESKPLRTDADRMSERLRTMVHGRGAIDQHNAEVALATEQDRRPRAGWAKTAQAAMDADARAGKKQPRAETLDEVYARYQYAVNGRVAQIPPIGGAIKPTRAQRKAEQVALGTTTGSVTKPPKVKKPKAVRAAKAKKARKSRKAFVGRIPKKHKIVRAAATATLGTGALLWGGTKLAGRGGRWTARKVAGKAVATARKRKWTPSAAGQRLRSSAYYCCDKKFSGAAELNKHFLTVHGEETGALLPPDRGDGGATKTLLPPAHVPRNKRSRRSVPAGRHRLAAGRQRAEKFIQAHRDKITRIGVQAMANVGETRNIAQAFQALGELRPPGGKEWTLGELRELLAGIERALLVGAEGFEQLERTFNRPQDQRGCNIDASVTRSGMRMMREGLAESARGATRVIADFETTFAPFIRAALNKPAIDMSRR